jgi:hypothetical protein
MTSIAFHPGSRAPNVAFGQPRQSCESMKPEEAAQSRRSQLGPALRKRRTVPAAPLFCGEVDAVNQWLSNRLLRKQIRLPAEPHGLAGVCFAHWNGLAVQADHQHWPFILVRATQLVDFIVHETSDRESIASDSPSGKSKRLPGVPYVVQAVPICPLTVLPCLAPHNTRQNEHNWRRAAGQPHFKRTAPALLRHVPRWIVMIQPIGPPFRPRVTK